VVLDLRGRTGDGERVGIWHSQGGPNTPADVFGCILAGYEKVVE